MVTTLTKRMAEDLTEYLNEHGARSEISYTPILIPLNAWRLFRIYAKALFDVLVGINLLREGLDMPEVSLVAILDADKEGFLRSERSLIQTIGRAARNLNGKAILYADKITGSMERAIGETNRRRDIQGAFNQEHGIVPKGVSKEIADVMQTGSVDDKQSLSQDVKKLQRKPQRVSNRYGKHAGQSIEKLEKLMLEAAKNLEFEKAAQYRDQIASLRETLFKKYASGLGAVSTLSWNVAANAVYDSLALS